MFLDQVEILVVQDVVGDVDPQGLEAGDTFTRQLIDVCVSPLSTSSNDFQPTCAPPLIHVSHIPFFSHTALHLTMDCSTGFTDLH